MKYEETIEVISINPSYDVIGGKASYQIIFGKYGKLKTSVSGQSSGVDSAANQIIIFIPREGECQYKVGSKWHFTVSETGSISVTKAEK